MADPSGWRGLKIILPIIGLVIASFSAGLAVSWNFMNKCYTEEKQNLQKAETNLSELSKDLGRVKTENDGLRRLVREKDDIINKSKAKGPENIENEVKLKEEEITNIKNELGVKQKELDQAKKENIGLSDSLRKIQKELEAIKTSFDEYRNKYHENTQATNVPGDKSKSNLENYEYKMREIQLRNHDTFTPFDFPISINVLDISKGKINAIIGSKGYPSLKINGAGAGAVFKYNARDSYEIKIIEVYDFNTARILIVQQIKILN